MIKIIIVTPVQHYRPQCEGEVMDKRYRDWTGQDYRCKSMAMYELNSKNLCHLHTGQALITKALKEQNDG